MDLRAILAYYDIRPSKGLGQSFLVAGWVYERILEAANLAPDDIVLEIGPGLGTLTYRLAQTAGQVVAVELDERMLVVLRDMVGGYPNVAVHKGDILETDVVALLARWLQGSGGAYKVVANLPYYITSRALRHLLTAAVRPQRMVLMVQRQVADRIVASPGEMSLLAVSVQLFGAAKRVCRVPSEAFYPRPKVDSAVLAVELYPEPRITEALLEPFFQVARAGFQQKRKQLHNSLVANLSLPERTVRHAMKQARIAPDRRPQSLDVGDWARLTEALFSPEGDQG